MAKRKQRSRRQSTGSFSANHYSSQRAESDRKNRRERSSTAKRIRRLVGSSLVIVLIVALSVQFGSIRTVEVSGGDQVLQEGVTNTISDAVGLKLLVNSQRLEDQILDDYPSIKSVIVGKPQPLSNSLQVEIEPFDRVAQFQYDNTLYDLYEGGSLQLATTQALESTLPLLVETVTESAPPNRLPARVASFVATFYGATTATIDRFEQTDSPRELRLYLSGVGYYVRLNIDRSATDQADELGNALEYLRDRGRPSRYIDLRVDNTAFYR